MGTTFSKEFLDFDIVQNVETTSPHPFGDQESYEKYKEGLKVMEKELDRRRFEKNAALEKITDKIYD